MVLHSSQATAPFPESNVTASAGSEQRAWDVLDTDAWWAQSTATRDDHPGPASPNECSKDASQNFRRSSGAGRVTMLESRLEAIAEQVRGIEMGQDPAPQPNGAASTPPTFSAPVLSAVHDRIDANHDGVISQEEFSCAVNEGVVSLTSPARPPTTPPKSAMNVGRRRFGNPRPIEESSNAFQRSALVVGNTDAIDEASKLGHCNGDASSWMRKSTTTPASTTGIKAPNAAVITDIHTSLKPTNFDLDALAEFKVPTSPRYPTAVAKALEKVVAYQIDGLGECLNICAQRSRTLKLLGFQHLHFDARLQAYLEQKAHSLGGLVFDVLLLARCLLGLREVTRQGCLQRFLQRWQHKLRSTQEKLRAAVSKRGISHERALRNLYHAVGAAREASLQFFFGEWLHTLSVEKQLKALRSMQARATKSFMAAKGTDSTCVVRSFLVAWREHTARWKHKRKNVNQIQMRIASELGGTRLQIISYWRVVAQNEKQLRLHLQAQQSMQKAMQEAQNRQRSVHKSGTVAIFELTIRHRAMTLRGVYLIAWLEVIRVSRENHNRKKDNTSRVTRAFRREGSNLEAECWFAWREKHQSTKQTSAMLCRQWRRTVSWNVKRAKQASGQSDLKFRYVSRAISSTESTLLKALIECWLQLVIQGRGRRAAKKRSIDSAMRKVMTLELLWFTQCFQEWARIRCSEALRRSSEALRRMAASHGHGLAILEKRCRDQDDALREECLFFWRQSVRTARSQAYRKRISIKHANRATTRENDWLGHYVFLHWTQAVETAKRERQMQDVAKQLRSTATKSFRYLTSFGKQFDAATVKMCFNGWSDVCANVRRMHVGAANIHRHMRRLEVGSLHGCIMAWWNEHNQAKKAVLKGLTRKLEADAVRSQQCVFATVHRRTLSRDAWCFRKAFGAWATAWQRSKLRNAIDMKSQLLMSRSIESSIRRCLVEWVRQVHERRYQRLSQTHNKLLEEAKNMVSQKSTRLSTDCCVSLAALIFARWRNFHFELKQLQKNAILIFKLNGIADTATIQTCFFNWQQDAAQSRLSKTTSKMLQKAVDRIEKQFRYSGTSFMVECLQKWSLCVEDRRGRRVAREQYLKKTIGWDVNADRELLALCVKDWSGEVAKHRIEKNAATALKKNKCAAGNSLRLWATTVNDQKIQLLLLKMFCEWLQISQVALQQKKIKANHNERLCWLCCKDSLKMLGFSRFLAWKRFATQQKLVKGIKQRTVLSAASAVYTASLLLLSKIMPMWLQMVKSAKLRLKIQHLVAARERSSRNRLNGSQGLVARMQTTLEYALVDGCFTHWLWFGKVQRRSRRRRILLLGHMERSVKAFYGFAISCCLLLWKFTANMASDLRHRDKMRSEQRSQVREHTFRFLVAEVSRNEIANDAWCSWRCIRAWWYAVAWTQCGRRLGDMKCATRLQLSQMRYTALQHQVRCNGATWAGDPNPELLLVAWHGVVRRLRDEKIWQGKTNHLRAVAQARARKHAEQLVRKYSRRVLATHVALWRLVIYVELERRDVTLRHAKCAGLKRAFIVQLRAKLYKQRFLFRWLWACPPKPREIEFSQFTNFSSKPTVFVRPVSDDSVVGPTWPISYVASSAIADRQHYQYHHARPVSASLTTNRPALMDMRNTSASRAASPVADMSSMDVELDPVERHVIATRAMTSDNDYRRLFEYNRQEIRDGYVRCHRCGRQMKPEGSHFADPSRSSQASCGVMGDLAAECVCQRLAEAERLAPPSTPAPQPANSWNRPHSAGCRSFLASSSMA